MDPTIGWYQPEQFGPAKELWLNIWEAEKGLDVLTLRNEHANNAMGVRLQQDFLALDTSPAAAATGNNTTTNTPSSNTAGTTNTAVTSTTFVGCGGGGGGPGNNNGGNANNGNNNGRVTTVHGNVIAGNSNGGEHRVPHNACNNYYNPSRRKSDNRASTYGMNYNYNALVGDYGGCPWRVPNKHYSKGVIG